MRPATRHKPLQNPFQNRFHEPVTWRLDEMQAHSNAIWPHQRSYKNNQVANGSRDSQGSFVGAFAFFVVLLASAVVLFRMV
jgi:hypothetical protein